MSSESTRPGCALAVAVKDPEPTSSNIPVAPLWVSREVRDIQAASASARSQMG